MTAGRPDGQLRSHGRHRLSRSEAIRDYIAAYVRDLLEQYPRITGFRPDWPEYPCYKLDEAFQDFNPQVARWASKNEFDYEVIHRDVRAAYDYLHGRLENRDLLDFGGPGRGAATLTALFRSFPGIAEWLRLKTALSNDLLRHWRSVITDHGGPEKELSANAFMVPLTLWTGFDFRGASKICDAVSPKLYTMHWSVMVEFWGRTLLEHNPGLDERMLVRALAHLFDLGDEITATRIDQYGYPGPDEPHPIPDQAQRRRIDQVCAEVNGRAQVTPLMHRLRSHHDFVRRFRVVSESSADGCGSTLRYLSDEKLDRWGALSTSPFERSDHVSGRRWGEWRDAVRNPMTRPNILFIMTDQHARYHRRAWADEHIYTPNYGPPRTPRRCRVPRAISPVGLRAARTTIRTAWLRPAHDPICSAKRRLRAC